MAVAQDDRPQFYQGQYIGPDDLSAGVEYSRIQQARHSLGAHTWGIAIGQQLLEKPSASGNNQVDVFIQPGYSWDGFGRPLVVLAPYKLPASLFQSITFDAAQDGGNPAGRLVKIWLQYREAPYQPAATGFATCDGTGNTSRVQETFQVQVGEASGSARDPVLIGGQTVDAQNALTAFDPAAPLLYDASVPQQAIPDDNPTALWLIPVGYVRWLPSQNPLLAGSFQKRNAQDLQASEALRQYIGVVAGAVLAAGSNVRVRSRGTLPSGVVSDDLFWVEGKSRFQDDVRLFGGKLSFLDAGGQDQGVPLSIQRFDQAAPQASGLQAVIGKAKQGKNSLAIGPLDTTNAFSPTVTFFDNGQVGIGTTTPDRLLTLQGNGGTYLNVKDSADKIEVLLGVDTNGGIVSTMTNHDLVLRAGGNADKMILKANGRVGVGTDSPETNLHLAGSLGVRQNYNFMSGDVGWSSFSYNAHHDQSNGGWVFPDSTHSAVTIEMDDINGRPRFQVFSTSPAAKTTWVDRLHLEGDTGNVYMGLNGGNTGIGTPSPDGKLTVNTATQGVISLFTPTGDFEYDGGVDSLFIFHARNARTAFQGGSVGIGTNTPQTLLDVNGVVTGISFVHPSDVNLKRNIEPLKDALKTLMKLRGVQFEWKDPERLGHGARTGFIAQEVETVFPEWIVEGASGQKMLSQEGLGAVIVEAIRELKTQVDALSAKVEELSSQGKARREKRGS